MALTVAVLALTAPAAIPAAVAAPVRDPSATAVYAIADQRIDEASGLGVGIRSPGVDYVENDSGDVNRFFALDAATGATAAVVTVPGATNIDWEDLAVAPAPDGTPSVWLADIGDNDGVRAEVDVYRVPEPRINPEQRDRQVSTAHADVWRLRYPSGATDAESLAVSPQGRAYLVTKSYLGDSSVYRVPPRPAADRVQRLTRVGGIQFEAHRTDNRFGTLATLAATSATISRNGALLAVRTYTDAYVWRLDDGLDDDVVAALRRAPIRIALPDQPQGEGIAFAGRRLLIDSEGIGATVYAVSLPARLTAAAIAPSTAPVSSSGTGVSSAAADAATSTAVRPSGSASTTVRRRSNDQARRSTPLSIIIVIALFGTVLYLGRRARRSMGS